MLKRCVFCCGFGWLVLAAWRADAAALSVPLAEMLACGSQPSPKSLQAARESYTRCKSLAPSDVRVDYALALVLVKQHKENEALPLLAQLASQPRGQVRLLATRLRIWVLLDKANLAEALAEAVTLAELLAQQQPPAGAGELLNETAGFLGRIFAYCEEPRASDLRPEDLQRHKRQVLERLGPVGREVFALAFADTVARYTELKAKLDEVRAQALTDQREREEEQRQELSRAQAELEHNRQQLQAKANIAFEELQAGLAELQAMWNVAAREQATVRADIVRFQRNIGRVAPALVPPGEDESRQDMVSRVQAGRMVRSWEQQIRMRAVEGTRWQMLGHNILQRCGALWARYRRDLAQLAEEQASLERGGKKLEADMKRLAKASRAGSAKLLELKAQLTAFSIYEEFPFEREKQRVLVAWQE